MRGVRLLVLAFTVACEDQREYTITDEDASRYAELRCAAMVECCESPADDCVARRRDALLGLEDRSETPLSFSGECMQQALSWVETLGCEDERHIEIPMCKLVHGRRRHGESCFTFGDIGFYGSDCDEGLQCASGTCVDDPLLLVDAPPGGYCNLQQGWVCEADHYCSIDQTCKPSARLGEACGEASQCLMPAVNYCAGLSEEQPGQCSVRPVLGEPCVEPDACGFDHTDDGGRALVCIEGVCSLPELGPAACSESLE